MIFSDGLVDEDAIRQELETMAERAAKERGIPLTIGAGRIAEGSGQIRASYESAKDALEYGAFLKNGGVMRYDEVPETSQAEQIPDRIDYDRMKECIRRGEEEALKATLKEGLDAAAAEAGASQTRIRNLMMHIAVRMTDCFRTIYGSMNAFREPVRMVTYEKTTREISIRIKCF